MTQHIFEFIINSRKAFIRLIDDLTIDELNQIPEGFNNNIFWNFAHIVVSTQTLSYVRTGILANASTVKYNDDYKKDWMSAKQPLYGIQLCNKRTWRGKLRSLTNSIANFKHKSAPK